jgi:HEAT repeat protein/beta-lactamase regulating signal transducer with metallopeptidase domain
MIPAGLDAIGAALVSWLLTYLIHSSILLAAAAVVAWRFAEQHAWLDLVWKGAVIAPLLTATIQPGVTAASLGGRWSIAAAPAASGVGAAMPEPVIALPEAAGTQVAGPAAGSEADRDRPAAIAAVAAPAVAQRPGRAAAGPSIVRRWPLLAAFAWLAIAIVALARYSARLFATYRELASGTPVTTDVLQQASGEAAFAPDSIAFTVSDHCAVPLAMAGRRIVVPERLFELAAEQQRAALAHEVAHVVRRDPEWRIAMDLVERALFFQPLNRLARARLSDAAEFLCDQWAVRHTQSPLALARCLSEVASWSTADRSAVGISAMARGDSAMVRRVTRILNGAADPVWRPRLSWLAVPIVLVSVAAPRVTATSASDAVIVRVPAPADPMTASADAVTARERAEGNTQEQPRRNLTPAEIAEARAQLRVYRPAQPGATLDDRWRWAMAEASRRGLTDFWIVYMFDTPTHADSLMMGDTRDGSFVSWNGSYSSSGPPLSALFDEAVLLEGGNVAALLHYRAARADAVDRAGYRSAGLGFDFGSTPVFWLGHAPGSQSFTRVRDLFGQVRGEKLQALLIDLASLHADSNVVIPFLTSLVEPSRPAAIRAEAAEGFEHHHDPRSVEVLLRVARTDADSHVRTEAAETIGEVQTPESIPALADLARQSADPEVRREAAEAFGDQPAERALPAIERLVAESDDEEVMVEAIEALGDLADPRVVNLLVEIANGDRPRRAQQEAVETLGDVDAPGVVDALTRIVSEHRDVAIQREAVETLGDRHDDAAALAVIERILRGHPREEVQAEAIGTLADATKGSLHPAILDLAVTGASPRIRREALESIGDSVSQTGDAQMLDTAERTMVRAIFDDPDSGVREEAIDALENLPGDRARRVLRDVIDRHPDARVRREAAEQLRERQ